MKGFTGVVSAIATLTVTSSGGGSGGGTTPSEPLVSISVIPNSQTVLVINENAAFFAFGTTASGATVDLTNKPASIGTVTIQPAAWTSTVPRVAAIDPTSGIATALTSGSTSITATAKNPDGTVVTGSATLTVTISSPGAGEPLVSLAVIPGTQTLSVANQSTTFLAIGTTASGTTVNLTNQSAVIGSATIKSAVWSSSSPGVATINSATGVATGASNGTTVITAIATNPDGTVVTGTAALTINIPSSPEPLTSLAILPGAQTTSVVGRTVQFIAIGTTSSGSTVNLTKQSATINGVTIGAVTWASSSEAVATVDPNTGVATAVSSGIVAISAIAKNPDGTSVAGTATLTVSTTPEPLVSLTVDPGSQTLTSPGQPAQFVAIGQTASGATVNLTNRNATVGPATIQAATWISSSPSIATIDKVTGLATAGSSGVTVVTAIATNPDGTVVTGSATLTINIQPTAEPLLSLAVVPGVQQALTINQAAKFFAIGATSAGTTVDLTSQAATIGSASIAAASWTSTNPSVATIDANGVATALSAGSTAIVAMAKNPDGTVVTGTAAYTITIPSAPEPLAAMAIVPAAQSLTLLGQTAQLTALATTGTNTTVDLTHNPATVNGATIEPAVWTSSNPGVASVNGTGVVTAVTAGTAAITAIASNPDGTVVTGTSIVTVTATGGAGGTMTSIAVIPGSQAVQSPSATADFIAIGTTSTGATVDLTDQVAWSSSSAQIATVGAATGHATGVGEGTATITALYTPPGGGSVVTGTSTFTVVNGATEPFIAVTIIPGTQSLSASGQTAQFVALATVGTTGFQQDVTSSPQIKWSSSAPSIASISSTGFVTGLSVGNTTITAELANPADGSIVSATASVGVTLTPAPSPLLSLSVIPNTISVGNLQDTGQFLAIGTFSTSPYVRDVTNSPNTTWLSSFPNDFPVNTNSGGTSSATAGIVTSYASGSATIIAEYADPTTQTIQTATATFNCPLVLPDPTTHPPTPGSCYTGQSGPLTATLTVFGEGLNTTNWLITAPSATATPYVIHCGPGWTGTGGSVCTGIYPVGTTVILTAPAQNGVAFGGWTNNCTPSDANGNPLPGPVLWTAAGPNYCTVKLTSIKSGSMNATVGAIFNNQ